MSTNLVTPRMILTAIKKRLKRQFLVACPSCQQPVERRFLESHLMKHGQQLREFIGRLNDRMKQ